MNLYYQDLQEIGQDEGRRGAFVLECIRQHKASIQYQDALDAMEYYRGRNVTISRYEKLIRDINGIAKRNVWAPNHKIKSHFFGFAVDQLSAYLFGNGVTFGNDATKAKLGEDFDQQVLKLSTTSQIGGVAFGFFDFDRLQVMNLTEFAPLYDADTNALKAGVRFWQVGNPSDKRPLRATLYELDGFTEYIQRDGENIEVFAPKQSYIKILRTSEADGTEYLEGRNYPGFPIVPWKNNDDCFSELMGKRDTIDALDLAKSNMVNNVDEGNLIYWALKNCGGMLDEDVAQFLNRVQTLHVANVDGGADSTAEPHAIEAPYQGTQTTIDMLKKSLYEDFQAFDASAVSAGNQTATAIKACYVPLDLKADKKEAEATRFILGILKIAGIEDKPSYTRNKIVNATEEAQTLLMGAEYLSDEYIMRKMLTLYGDADMYDEVMQQQEDAEMARMDTTDNQEDAEDESNSQDGTV